MDFDDVIEIVGPFGKYQKLIIFLVLQPALFPCGFLVYNSVFMAATPSDYWCKLPTTHNASADYWKSLLPVEERDGKLKHSQCYMYDVDYDVNVTNFTLSSTSKSYSNESVILCKYGWNYDRSVYQDTVVTEYQLFCTWKFGAAFAFSLATFGGIFGPLLFGWLTDRWGRKPTYFLMIAFQSIFSVAEGFLPNFWWYLLCRFCVGATTSFSYTIPYLLSIELTGKSTRVLMSVICSTGYTVSVMVVVGIAYIFRSWRHLNLVSSALMVCLLALWKVFPESPRWLLARGRFKELEAMLRKIAKVNGKTLPVEFDKNLPKILREIDTEDSTQRHSIFDLFRTPNIRKKTLILSFTNFCNVGVFMGLNYYAPAFGDDPHLNSLLSGVVEFPPYIFAIFFCNRLGRRLCLISAMIMGAIACLTACSVPSTAVSIIMILTLAAKFCITLTFMIGELLEEEMFPTVIRGEGHSVTSLLSSVAGCTAPFIVHLGHSLLVLPLAIFGGLCLLAGFFALFLPETTGTDLPQTIEDGEQMGKNMSWRDVFTFKFPINPDKAKNNFHNNSATLPDMGIRRRFDGTKLDKNANGTTVPLLPVQHIHPCENSDSRHSFI